MGEIGILTENDRTELLDGEITRMSPIGSRHAAVVSFLHGCFHDALGRNAVIWSQNPLGLSEESEPEPDLMVLRPRQDQYRKSLPQPADVLLLIEVSDTTLPLDRGPKLSLYARAGITEYWVVDLVNNALITHRAPVGEEYADLLRIDANRAGPSTIAPKAFPDCHLRIADLFA